MFQGDIVCRSKLGYGSNFIFVVALGSESMDGLSNNLVYNNRILNPVKKQYQKIDIFLYQTKRNWSS